MPSLSLLFFFCPLKEGINLVAFHFLFSPFSPPFSDLRNNTKAAGENGLNGMGGMSGGATRERADGLSLLTNEYGQPTSPISLTPVLVDSQIQRLSNAAEALVKALPLMDPKLANNKKRISKELEVSERQSKKEGERE